MITLRGVSPVLEVPFKDDETLDVESFVAMAQHVAGTGVSSVMFPGFASEYYKLTDAERALLIAELLNVLKDFPTVDAIISVPDHATIAAVAVAQRAIELGAGAINVLPPHLAGPPAAAVHRHIETLLSAVDPVPVILQHAPAQTGSALSVPQLEQLRDRHPNLAAIKVESNPPGAMIAALSALARPIPAFVGYAGLQLIDAHARGAVGLQPGCSFVELYVSCWEMLERGDQEGAYRLHARMVPFLSYWMQSVELIVAAEKEISRRRGLIATGVCREPGYSLDDIELAMIDRFMVQFERELTSD